MELSQQVCTLAQAKKLKELFITCDSIFSHWEDSRREWVDNVLIKSNTIGDTVKCKENAKLWQAEQGIYPAYNVAELGVMLPDGASIPKLNIAQFNSFRTCREAKVREGEYCCFADFSTSFGGSEDGDIYKVWEAKFASTEAQARAAMLIYLLANNHTSAAEVNQRLTT